MMFAYNLYISSNKKNSLLDIEIVIKYNTYNGKMRVGSYIILL